VFHQYLFQQFECRLVKSTGSNNISIESSITSNYFNKLYRRVIGLVDQENSLAFANIEITIRRFFFQGQRSTEPDRRCHWS